MLVSSKRLAISAAALTVPELSCENGSPRIHPEKPHYQVQRQEDDRDHRQQVDDAVHPLVHAGVIEVVDVIELRQLQRRRAGDAVGVLVQVGEVVDGKSGGVRIVLDHLFEGIGGVEHDPLRPDDVALELRPPGHEVLPWTVGVEPLFEFRDLVDVGGEAFEHAVEERVEGAVGAFEMVADGGEALFAPVVEVALRRGEDEGAPSYAHLVRANAKFYNATAFGMDVSLFGVKLRTETLKTMVSGGIGMAVPDEPEAPVEEGARFRLENEPDEEWLEWSPSL